MTLNVYNVRDERANEFGTPIFTDKDTSQMIDVYHNTVKDAIIKIDRMTEISPVKAAEFAMQASQLRDAVIYHVGTFDSVSGKISFFDEPNLVVRVGDLFPKNFAFGVSNDA